MLPKILIFFLLLNFSINCYTLESVDLAQSPYPIWAHYHWIWLANPDETQESSIQLLKDYQSHSIPVGAINLDSAWPDKYQNFKWNQKKFPQPKSMIDYFHSQNVKVLAWITSTVNNDSSNFDYGKKHGFFLNQAKLVHWWRGHGALLDYSNPKAVEWWHEQMDYLLDMGIDGWKCDGTDPYVLELIDAQGYKGHITEREYADYYYRDFYYHTKVKRGEALIMARPVDNFKDFIFLDYAPKDVMFSGWVGDQKGNWDGLRTALINIVHSAWNNYLNFGMDIGGYVSDGKWDLGREKTVFVRWFQLGAFLPLMENGGNGEHRPWKFGQDVMQIYRKFAWIHTDLSLFFLTSGTECYYKNISVIKPIAHRILPFTVPTTFDYILNNDLFISPILNNSTRFDIKLPPDSWTYWFNASQSHRGELRDFRVPLDEYPVFVRDGSILPLHVQSNFSSLGSNFSKDYVTLMITRPKSGRHEKLVYEYKSSGYLVRYDYDSLLNEIDIEVSANENNKYIILMNGIKCQRAISSIEVGGGKFETIPNRKESAQFWNDLVNSSFKSNANQMFIKLVGKNEVGIHLRIKNI
ncbi:glycoside hydrolase [Brachionus plicatilis]|uniref:Glycoside hydrolase n=1 Tax=Brachionus plicatilis TaxID=10195 RepID=A0A3M7QAB3_BRAPC|nr:glycoside hydrolase [Brachionus plicatilis]